MEKYKRGECLNSEFEGLDINCLQKSPGLKGKVQVEDYSERGP